MPIKDLDKIEKKGLPPLSVSHNILNFSEFKYTGFFSLDKHAFNIFPVWQITLHGRCKVHAENMSKAM